MRKLLATLVLVAAGFLVASAVPEVPEIKMASGHAYTPEDITKEMNREKMAKMYAAATRVVERVYVFSARSKSRCSLYSSIVAQAAVDARLTMLQTRLFAGLVSYESSCDPNAVSTTGDVGLTQLHAKFFKAWTVAQLKDPETNVRISAKELASHFHKYGTVEGLHRYNGFGNPTLDYPRAVFAHAGVEFTS